MRQFAKDTVKRWLGKLLHTHDTPERTSLAFAIGVFVAFLPPVPWVHTLIALVIAFAFRLNRIATLVGAYINTPLTFIPVFVTEVSLGVLLLGGREIPDIELSQLYSRQGWLDAGRDLRPFIVPMMLGSILVGLAASGISYVIALRVIRAYRHRVSVEADKAAAEAARAANEAAGIAEGGASDGGADEAGHSGPPATDSGSDSPSASEPPAPPVGGSKRSLLGTPPPGSSSVPAIPAIPAISAISAISAMQGGIASADAGPLDTTEDGQEAPPAPLVARTPENIS